MQHRPSGYPGEDGDRFGFAASRYNLEQAGVDSANSSEEVIGEIGLVLIVILGIVLAINVALSALHIA